MVGTEHHCRREKRKFHSVMDVQLLPRLNIDEGLAEPSFNHSQGVLNREVSAAQPRQRVAVVLPEVLLWRLHGPIVGIILRNNTDRPDFSRRWVRTYP